MTEFEKRYYKLNDNQKIAVNATDGPVMVVAGPGTGKTELLSVRVANILDKTDALPQNILCLTFTDNAASNMRQRLVGLLGSDAYKVAVHTFHSFGSEVINQNGQYFYSGAHFRPADELSSHEILTGIIEKLPHDNPLSSKFNDKFTYLKDIQRTISELKRGGLTPDELDTVLDRNDGFIDWVKPKLAEVFSASISKKTLAGAKRLADEIASYREGPLGLPSYHPLATLLQNTLDEATREAEEANSTKPLTAWKGKYLEKNVHGNQTLKDEKRGLKLRALSRVYFDYLLAMQERELYDYDDMILRGTHAMEAFDDLRFNLQEQYQYILVDEFQDTNDAQMRLVWNLTNNPVAEGRPNLMVVGDDDQAIYRFQGAELSNILDFVDRYREVKVITLTDNYRSSSNILDLSRSVIVQGQERLENKLQNISKILTPRYDAATPLVDAASYETPIEARTAMAKRIMDDISKQPASTRAVIARKHAGLAALLPHLSSVGLKVRYEREENILDNEAVSLTELTARAIWCLAKQDPASANTLIAQVLTHPAWGISASELWKISLESHRQKRFWLETMLEQEGELRLIAEWFVRGSKEASLQPLEFMLDFVSGINDGYEFKSPYKDYFFGQTKELSIEYLSHLAALQKIRSSLRDYRPGVVLKLEDFIKFVDIHRELGPGLSASSSFGANDVDVVLLTAHKAKGLEFDAVYVADANESVWGATARSKSDLLKFPSNLPLSPAGDSDDERLRLLYVALTRARNQLSLISSRNNENGKEILSAGAFAGVLDFTPEPSLETDEAIESLETDWRAPLLKIPNADKASLLAPILEKYRLSATHLNNYLDVTKGGPEYFLLHNLLRLPEAMPASAMYGSAVHAALQRAHQHLAATKEKRSVEKVLNDFRESLAGSPMSDLDRQNFLNRGEKALTTFLDQRYGSFTPEQIVERNFSGDQVVLGEAVVTGAIDLININHDEKTIHVTDYKTGKAAHSWKGRDKYEKIKLHHYEQQLMIYKLLVENSRQFAGYTVIGARLEFVEPDERGEIVLLDYVYDKTKLAEFAKLIRAVWQNIMSLNFTLPDGFEENIDGIVKFEESLLR